ncbi:MAG: glycosyltransferase family 2 protein [bacterium]
MKASVCLATCNRADVLERTLASIFTQCPGFEWEVIVADDASEDGTSEVCRDYSVEYHRIDRLPGYRNPAAARNVAYRAARGEVVICQSDDVLHTRLDTIDRLVGDLEPGKFLIATVTNVNENGKPYGDRAGKGWGDGLVEYTGHRHRRPLFFLGSLWRRDLYAVGGNDEEFIGPGYDDDWFAACLVDGLGLEAAYSSKIIGHHQHHQHTQDWRGVEMSRELFKQKMASGVFCSSGGPWV